MNEMWLPRLPSSPPRTFTGTSALSATGCSPRRSRYARMPPATAASTTSLTPRSVARASPRADPPAGAPSTPGAAAATAGRSARSPVPRIASGSARGSRAGRRRGAGARSAGGRARRAQRPNAATRAARRSRSRTPRASRRSALGRGAGRQSSGSDAAAAGVGSSSIEPSSTAAMPSTMQWWALPTIANCPRLRVPGRPTSPTTDGRGAAASTSPGRPDRATDRCPVHVTIDRERLIVDPLGRVHAPSGTGASFWR